MNLYSTKSILLCGLAALLVTCVEPIEFEVPEPQYLLVVEGMISDQPEPYTVKLSQAMPLDTNSTDPTPVTDAQVVLFDDLGNSEPFNETDPGVYTTGGAICGEVGRSYHIEIRTRDGKTYESEPDRLNPGGEITEISFEFEARTVQEYFGEVNQDFFHVLVDASAGTEAENYVRWKFQGTYKVLTYPELYMRHTPPYTPYKDPFPCSGYIVVAFVPGGKLEQVGPCACCTCWVSEYEKMPQLSDNQLVTDNQFNNVKVGEVQITNSSFYEKYLVEVEQMSLSKAAFDFFKLIREQKEEASSLFQPAFGTLKGNIVATNPGNPVVGLFWATSISKKSRFIQRSDVPYPLTPITVYTHPCMDLYPNSTTEQPAAWE